MRISDWSSDVCSSDLAVERVGDIGEVGDIGRTIDRSVAAERARNFPGPVIGELAAKAEGALPGFGLLEEFSRPALDEHAAPEQQILSRRVGRFGSGNRNLAQRARGREQSGRAQGRERVCPYVETAVVA